MKLVNNNWRLMGTPGMVLHEAFPSGSIEQGIETDVPRQTPETPFSRSPWDPCHHILENQVLIERDDGKIPFGPRQLIPDQPIQISGSRSVGHPIRGRAQYSIVEM